MNDETKHHPRALRDPIRAAALSLGLAAALACGCGDSGPSSELRVPSLRNDFGGTAYTFVTQQSDGGLTQLVLHSDGTHAVLLVLKDGTVERSQSARFEGGVADSVTMQVTRGRVNVDGNGTFTDNDEAPASGYVIASEDELTTSQIQVGSVVELTYDFRAVLSGTVNAADYEL